MIENFELFSENGVIPTASPISYPSATTRRATANGLAHGWFHWGLKAYRPTAPPPTGTLPHPKHRGKPGESRSVQLGETYRVSIRILVAQCLHLYVSISNLSSTFNNLLVFHC